MTRSRGIRKRTTRLFKDQKQAMFLKAFAKLGTVRAAIEATGISRSCHDRWKADPTYVERYEQARQEFGDKIEAAVLKRVEEGEPEFIPNVKTGIAYAVDKRGNPDFTKPILQKKANAQRDLAVLRRFKPEYREESNLNVAGGIAVGVFSKPELNVALIKEVMGEVGSAYIPALPSRSAEDVIDVEAHEVHGDHSTKEGPAAPSGEEEDQ